MCWPWASHQLRQRRRLRGGSVMSYSRAMLNIWIGAPAPDLCVVRGERHLCVDVSAHDFVGASLLHVAWRQCMPFRGHCTYTRVWVTRIFRLSGRKFNQPISEVVWPTTLEKLKIGNAFNHPITGVVWPASLETPCIPRIRWAAW